MKKFISLCLLCVIFLISTFSVGYVFAFENEILTFHLGNKVFTYSLEENLKHSSVFETNYEINKYNRFGSKEERISLLKHMLELGFDKSIALDYLFPNLSNKITSISKNVFVAPQNAKLNINSNSEKVFNISPEVIGKQLDKNKLMNNICFNFIHKKEMNFSLPIKTINPTLTKEYYDKFTNLRADFATNISSSSPDRKHNIKTALMSLNKIEILPNQIFSFNKTIGRRTADNGYRQAKIIINNEFVDGLGGGVCQVSSTLYNCALLAGLEIVEANKHSKQVSYVQQGFDAMVNFGSSDLKFRNNTTEKITIITNFSQKMSRIRMYGEKMCNTQFKLTNEVFNIIEPIEEVLIDEKQEYKDKILFNDEYFFLKTANKGMEIKSYREKYVNNTLISKELLRHDKYKVQNAVKIYGALPHTDKKSTENICA